jgi:hypothetical protein
MRQNRNKIILKINDNASNINFNMRHLFYSRFFVLFSIMSLNLFGQEQIPMPVNVPLAPNPAALMQYVSLPVSKYSGIPNISIPIYTISQNGFEWPISINYHASGVKVAQESSSVGLGWVLNCGGSITRQVNCIDDFENATEKKGFLTSPALLDYLSYDGICQADWLHYWQECYLQESALNPFLLMHNIGNCSYSDGSGRSCVLVEQIADTESDTYFYSFGNYSGKFVIKKDGTAVIYSLGDGLKIRVINGSCWEAIDRDGIIYRFKDKEYTSPYTYSRDGYDDVLLNCVGGSSSGRYISSWLISEIILPNGKRIEFNYDDWSGDYIWAIGSIETSKEIPIQSTVTCSGGTQLFSFNRAYTKTSSQIEELTLESIKWSSGELSFSYSQRKDVPGSSILGGAISLCTSVKCDEILVKDNLGAVITTASLSYSYFNSQYENEQSPYNKIRLKLDSIIINDDLYQFAYDRSNQLPFKNDLGYDHWGYFNGQDNRADSDFDWYSDGDALLIPELYITDYQYFDNYLHKKGANRECNPSVLTIGILNKITYPTKGEVQFEYEANDFEQPLNLLNTSYGLLKYSDFNNDISLRVTGDYDNIYPSSQEFEIPEETTIKYDFGYAPSGQIHNPFSGDCTSPFGVIYKIVNQQEQVFHEFCFMSGYYAYTHEGELTLPAGQYRAQVGANFGIYNAWGRIDYTEEVEPPESKHMIGGGVRVKSVISEQNTRRFEYFDKIDKNLSSGKLLVQPNYCYLDPYSNFKVFKHKATFRK